MVKSSEVERQTLIEQRLRIRMAAARRGANIPRRSTSDPAPLSAAQQRVWILYQLDPASPAFNRPVAVWLLGHLDRTALEAAINEIVRRHESLRTVFPDGNGEPRQVVLPPALISIDFQDLMGLPSDAREAEARRIASFEAQQVFDLENVPAFGVKLFRIGEREHVLVVLMHHIIFDGWSEGVLLHELQQLYSAFVQGQASPLSELNTHCADFAAWQQTHFSEDEVARQVAYWREELAGAPSSLNLPADFPRQNVRHWSAGRCTLQLSTSLTEDLKALSRDEHLSLFMTLLAAFQLLLAYHADQDDIVVGVPTAGRTHIETEPLIGCFMNVLVLRMRAHEDLTVRRLLAQVRDTALRAYANQEAPFHEVVKELRPERRLDRWPLFQVMFQLRNLPNLDSPDSTSLKVAPFSIDTAAIGGLDLSLEVEEVADGLHCLMSFDSQLFRPETAERMMEHFRNLLEAMVDDPEQRVWELPMLSGPERQRLLVEWNDTAAEFPRNQCVHELFERQVEKTPDAIAAVFEGRRLTYRELNCRANQLARYLCRLGASPETLVGICVERSLEVLIGVLGVLKAGAAYLPLDPDYPRERLALLIEDAKVQIVLTQQSLVENLPEQSLRALRLDTDWERISKEEQNNVASGASSENLAYVIYTSGSTGRPKGVMICHRSVCNFLHWRNAYFPLGEGARLLHRAALTFDDSVWELLEPLATGATVVIASPGGDKDSTYLADLLAREKVTAACFVPSMLQLLLEEPHIGDCTALRRLTTGAEVLPVEVHNRVFECLQADFYNGYGPTEATVAASYYHCRTGGDIRTVPIGRPIANTQIYVLGRRRQLMPIGAVGEICIGGAGLARGYLHRPDLTAEKFIPHLFSAEPGARLYRTGDLGRYLPDGNIEFLGRLDNQVKVRGFRIELEEVEEVLRKHTALRDVAVTAARRASGDQLLVAYIVARTGQIPEAGDLRPYLQEKLPDYMIPGVFMGLESIPRLPSGKIDRKALPEPDLNAAPSEEIAEPQTPTEERVSQIWSEILGVGPIGRNDDFFALGGHSVAAGRVMLGVRKEFGVKVKMVDLFRYPTVAGIAGLIDHMGRH